MRRYSMSNKFGESASKSYDPLQRAEIESPSFNAAWLKNGESLTLFQRAGFTFFSLVFLGIGLGLTKFSLLEFRESDLTFTLIFGAGSLFFILFGVLGLRNVLRFGNGENTRHKHFS